MACQALHELGLRGPGYHTRPSTLITDWMCVKRSAGGDGIRGKHPRGLISAACLPRAFPKTEAESPPLLQWDVGNSTHSVPLKGPTYVTVYGLPSVLSSKDSSFLMSPRVRPH